MERLRGAVIGGGFFGQFHSRIISESGNVELVAVADNNKLLKDTIQSSFNCNFYNNYKEMIEKEKLDFISICTPDDFHVEPCIFAAENNINILLEKPMARTAEDCYKIWNACEKNNVRIMVAHILRFDPAYKKLCDCVKNGALGEIVHLNAGRESSRVVARKLNGQTSILFYIGVHDLDIAQWITGRKITKVYAQKINSINKKWNMDDCIYVLANLGSDIIANFQFSFSFNKLFPAGLRSRFEIYGSRGTAFLNRFNQGLEIYKDTDESVGDFSEQERWTKDLELPFELVDTMHWPEIYNQIRGALRNEIDHFIYCLIKDKEFAVDTDDAINAVIAIGNILESLSKNKPIKINN